MIAVWYDASDITTLYQDSAKTSLVATDGQSVGCWADKSGNGYDVLQATAGNRPVYKANIKNGLSVVRFSGVNQYMQSSAFPSPIAQPATIYVVFNVTKTTEYRMLFDGLTSGNRWTLQMYPTLGHYLDFFNGGSYSMSFHIGASTLDYSVVTIVVNDTDKLRRDGYAVRFADTGSNSLDGLTLGINYALSGMTDYGGDFCELRIYGEEHTTAETLEIEAELREKWDIDLIGNPPGAGWQASNAASALTIPTYDGSGQNVHPSVVDFGEGVTWNGYRYWMAMTPFPSGDADYENPSIVVSNDNSTWIEPPGITNPIEADPGGSNYNQDPCLVYDSGTDKLYCFYGQVTTTQAIYVRESSDGIDWNTRSTILSGATLHSAFSSSVVKVGNTWWMWTINTPSQTRMEYRTSSILTSGWSSATPCSIYNIPDGKQIWHIDNYYDGGMFHGVWSFGDYGVSGTNTLFYYARSNDGIVWFVEDEPLLSVSAAGWDKSKIYKASIKPIAANRYHLWYSAVSVNTWKSGYTIIYLPSMGSVVGSDRAAMAATGSDQAIMAAAGGDASG